MNREENQQSNSGNRLIRIGRIAAIVAVPASFVVPWACSSYAGYAAMTAVTSSTQSWWIPSFVSNIAAVHAGAQTVNAVNMAGNTYGLYAMATSAVSTATGVVVVLANDLRGSTRRTPARPVHEEVAGALVSRAITSAVAQVSAGQ